MSIPRPRAIVFASGAAITVLPLDVTHLMRSTPRPHRRPSRLSATVSGAAVAAMLSFSERFDVEKYGWEGAPLHDPCVTAFVLRARHLQGRGGQCGGRDRQPSDPRHDRLRLLGRHRPAAERDLGPLRRCRCVLRAAHRADRPAAVSMRGPGHPRPAPPQLSAMLGLIDQPIPLAWLLRRRHGLSADDRPLEAGPSATGPLDLVLTGSRRLLAGLIGLVVRHETTRPPLGHQRSVDR